MKTGVFIISAPSGSGKTTLMGKLLQELSSLHFSVSYTTRQPRGQEQNGKEYFFVTCEEFQKMIQQQDLLEWAEVFGNYYGTARRFLEEAREAGIDLLLDIDVQGASQVKEKLAEATSVFILPPSRKELEWRLRHRSQDTEKVIQNRLRDAGKEIQGYHQYDYILINDQLEHSAEQLKAIVLAERWRRQKEPQAQPGSKAFESVRALAEGCLKERVQTQVQPILASFGG